MTTAKTQNKRSVHQATQSYFKLIIFATCLVLILENSNVVAAATATAGLQQKLNANIDTAAGTETATSTETEFKFEMKNQNRTWRLITRADWQARQPATREHFAGPSPYVIVHHSYQPGVCRREDGCKAAMRSMQNFHMDGHGWPDIGYTYAVGGDGNVYEARGYNVVGAHAPNYNSRSIGLLLIGNFVAELPPAPMLQVAKEFLRYSVEIGQLKEDYILYGHRQVRSTDCPGDALYHEITKWPHWQQINNSKKA